MITWPQTFQTKLTDLSLQPVAVIQGVTKVLPRVTNSQKRVDSNPRPQEQSSGTLPSCHSHLPAFYPLSRFFSFWKSSRAPLTSRFRTIKYIHEVVHFSTFQASEGENAVLKLQALAAEVAGTFFQLPQLYCRPGNFTCTEVNFPQTHTHSFLQKFSFQTFLQTRTELL